MSRSRKHHPITGVTTCRSEKQDKVLANRRLRRHQNHATEQQSEILPHMREIVEPYCDFGKDGKINWTGTDYENKARRK
jgi:hypothetical protein